MSALRAALRKEFLLLFRDLHGLLLLFVMPTVFIVIMSLAMQDSFAALKGAKLEVLVSDRARNDDSNHLLSNLAQSGALSITMAEADVAADDLLGQVQRDQAAFLLIIDPISVDEAEDDNPLQVTAVVAPGTNKQTEAIFVASVRELLRAAKVERMLAGLDEDTFGEDETIESLAEVKLAVEYAYPGKGEQEAPSSVQQNVPAWLVFAMFFVVVPLSNTLIRERQFGTLRRLQTIAVSPAVLILGKLVPYFVVMQLQVILMLLVGSYLLPLLGGDGLALNVAPAALIAMAFSASIAALGYALVIAVSAKTTEQATTLGGAGNIILAALGGVMIPRMMMPEVMQQIGLLSPMAWALEGFLDVFLRGGSLELVWTKALGLTAFGITLALIAFAVLLRGRNY